MKKFSFIFLLATLMMFGGCESIFKSLDDKSDSEEVVTFELQENLNEGNFDSVLDSVDEEIENDAELNDLNTEIAVSNAADDAEAESIQLAEDIEALKSDAENADTTISDQEGVIATKETELADADSTLETELNSASTDDATTAQEIHSLIDSSADEELQALTEETQNIEEEANQEIATANDDLNLIETELSNADSDITEADSTLSGVTLSSEEIVALETITKTNKVIVLAEQTQATVDLIDEELTDLEADKIALEEAIAAAQSSLSISRIKREVSLASLIARLSTIRDKIEEKTLEKEESLKELKTYNKLKDEAIEKRDDAIQNLRTDIKETVQKKTDAEIKKGVAKIKKDIKEVKKANAEARKAQAKADLAKKTIAKAELAIQAALDKGDQLSDTLEAALNEKIRIAKEKAEAEKKKAEAEKDKAEYQRLQAEQSKNQSKLENAQAAQDFTKEDNSTTYIEDPNGSSLVEKWLNQKEATKTLINYNITKAKATLGKANIKASDVLDTLIELNNNKAGSDTNVNLTDIVTTYTPAQKSYLKEALKLYNSYLPDPEVFTASSMEAYRELGVEDEIKELKEYTQDNYLGLVVATVIDTGNLLISILNRYNDPEDELVEYYDDYGNLLSIRPPVLNSADKFTDEAKSYITGREYVEDIARLWDANRSNITDTLVATKGFAKAYFDLIDFYEYKTVNGVEVLKDKDIDDLSPNEDLVVTLEDIIGEIEGEDADLVTEADYNQIIDEVLTAVD